MDTFELSCLTELVAGCLQLYSIRGAEFSCYFLCDVALEWPAGAWAITGVVVRLCPAWLCLDEL